jgi:hypothetical protein
MNKGMKFLLIIVMILIGITGFAKSQISQNPAFIPREENNSKDPFYFCYYVIAYDWIWVSLKSSLYNDCFGNYAITNGSNAWWYGTMANPASFGGWSILFAGWQYPKNIGDQQAGQIVYDHNIMWGANKIISDFLWESDIQSPEESLVYYPGKYNYNNKYENGLTSFYGFYFSLMKGNEDIESYSQWDYISYVNDSEANKPLGISGELRNLRWNYPNADDFTIHLLTLSNDSEIDYDPFYFALYMDADVDAPNAAYNVAYYEEAADNATAYIFNPSNENLGVVGITIFDTSVVHGNELDIGYDESANFADPWVWEILQSGEKDTSHAIPYDARILMTLGPYSLPSGATVEISWANPMGYDEATFKANVNTLVGIYENDWIIPNPPPEAPFMTVEAGDRSVELKWSRNRNYIRKPLPKGQQGFYTEENDPSPEYTIGAEASIDPSSHVRDWDGYRVYRNLTGTGDIVLGDYALVAQLDSTYIYNTFNEPDGLPEGQPIPENELDPAQWKTTYYCEYTDTDPSIYNGFTYFYSVCSYDTGDRTSPNPDEWIDPAYSSALANVTPATPAWHRETTEGKYRDKVEVVPNPYIEGEYTSWEESYRKIDFIHLPENGCQIKIYTLSGLLVRTINHTDPDADESWNLNNNKGQILAAGAYIFRVIPEDGSDEITGKFMLIR